MSVNDGLNWIANFIWGIANDVLRDVYVRGKYRDVILPMTVIRRLDVVLEPTKQEVLKTKKMLDDAGIVNQDIALQQASGQAFYNTSPLRYEISGLAPVRSSSRQTSKPISTVSRLRCRTFWRNSSSETRYRRLSKPTSSAI